MTVASPIVVRTRIRDAIAAAIPELTRVEEHEDGQLTEEDISRQSLSNRHCLVAWIGTDGIAPSTPTQFDINATFAIMVVTNGRNRSSDALQLATKIAALINGNEWDVVGAENPAELAVTPIYDKRLKANNTSLMVVTFQQRILVDVTIGLLKAEAEPDVPAFGGFDFVDEAGNPAEVLPTT